MFQWWKRRRLLAKAPVLAADTPDGTLVQVTGRARALEHLLYAPASGTPSVIFRIEARDMGPNEPGGMQGGSPFESVDACPFVLETDGAGAITVACEFAVLVGFPSRRVTSLSGHWAEYVQRTGLHSKAPRETAIRAGARIKVVGVVERRSAAPGSEAGFRDAPSEIFLVADFDRPLLVAPAR